MILEFLTLTIRHWLASPTLARVPETEVTTDPRNVADYDRITGSVMMVPYVLALDMIERNRHSRSGLRVADLCCGPGVFSVQLARLLEPALLIGVDLSDPMLERARMRTRALESSCRFEFMRSDVSTVEQLEDSSVDLVSFMHGAHQFPTLEKVRLTLLEADRICCPDGLVFVMDPVRPRSRELADDYVDAAGRDYLERGLRAFHSDFRASVLASWSAQELIAAIPPSTKRRWIHWMPFGFPAFQVILGLPFDREPSLSSRAASDGLRRLLPREFRLAFLLLKLSFLAGTAVARGVRRDATPVRTG